MPSNTAVLSSFSSQVDTPRTAMQRGCPYLHAPPRRGTEGRALASLAMNLAWRRPQPVAGICLRFPLAGCRAPLALDTSPYSCPRFLPCSPQEAVVMAQAARCLPPTWETQSQFLCPGSQLWLSPVTQLFQDSRVNWHTGHLFTLAVSLSPLLLCLSNLVLKIVFIQTL